MLHPLLRVERSLLRRTQSRAPPPRVSACLGVASVSSARTLQAVAPMTITITGLLILLIIAGICGAIGRAIGGGTGGGFIVSIAVGFIGALFGTFIAHYLHLPELMMVSV